MKNYVNTMELKKVYMIDPEATQGCLACLDKVKARRADIVRPFTQPERRLRRDQNLISTSFDRFAQDFLGCSSRTDVGAVKQFQTGIQARLAKVDAIERLQLSSWPGKRYSDCIRRFWPVRTASELDDMWKIFGALSV